MLGNDRDHPGDEQGPSSSCHWLKGRCWTCGGRGLHRRPSLQLAHYTHMLDGFGFGGSRRHALEKRPVLLIFSDPGCTQCAELMPQVAEWQDRHRQALVITVISRGDPSAKQAQAADFGVHSVLLQKDSEIADKFA